MSTDLEIRARALAEAHRYSETSTVIWLLLDEVKRLAERPTLTEERVREVVLSSIRLFGIQQTGGHFIEDNVNRRDLDAVTDRIARELVGEIVGDSPAASVVRAAERAERGASTMEEELWPAVRRYRAAKELAGAAVDAAQRESDLREAVLYGCRFVAGRATIDETGDDLTVSVPSIEDCEDLATGYAHRKAAAPLAPAFDRAAVAITGQPAAELGAKLHIEQRSYPSPGFDTSDVVPVESIGAWEPDDQTTTPAPLKTMAEVQTDGGERPHVESKEDV